MTDIIELAKKAGLELDLFNDNFSVLHGKLINLEQLIRADERELCAKVCDVTPPYPFRPSIEAAHAIRARGTT